MMPIQGCPKKQIDFALMNAINIASMCKNGVFPVSGGILDQSAWFIDLWTTLESEQAKIEQERFDNV